MSCQLNNQKQNIKPYVKCKGETISKTCKRNDKISFNTQLLSQHAASLYGKQKRKVNENEKEIRNSSL